MNPEYMFDEYEENIDHLLNKVRRLQVEVVRWRDIADLLMSAHPSQVGLGRRLYAALVEGDRGV
jgi:hypothetical protein